MVRCVDNGITVVMSHGTCQRMNISDTW